MKKTYTINLSNLVFHIDEDACVQLQNYIKILEKHYLLEEDGQEIMADIENRIAELFREFLDTQHRESITLSDIDKVIEVMGTPDVIINEDGDTTHKPESNAQELNTRKLYRDTDEAIIGGVASGLANYLCIQVLWIRLAFALFTVFYGFAAIVYIVLWIIVPAARTAKQKLEMQGEKINVSNIEKNIRNTYNQMKEESQIRRIVNDLGEGISKFFSKVWEIVLQIFSLLGKFIATISFIGGISLLCLTLFLILGIQHYIPHPEYVFLQYICSPTPLWLLKTLSLLLLSLPLLLIIYYSAAHLFKFRGHKAILYSMTGVWMLCCITGIMMGIVFFTRFSQNYKSENTLSLNTPKNDRTLNIRFNNLPYSQYSSSCFRLGEYLHNYSDSYAPPKNYTKLYFRPNIIFETTKEDTPQLLFVRTTQGINGINANENIENIDYSYKWENDTLTLNTFFALQQPECRFNYLKIEIQLPENYRVYMENVIPDNLSYWCFHNTNKFESDLSRTRQYIFKNGLLYEDKK